MSDCSDVEVRDVLPDLVHGTLDASVREHVEGHLAECPECAEEVALLRSALGVMRGTPIGLLDTATIVRALPRPRPAALGRRSSLRLQLAAAVTVISLGGLSLAVARDRLGSAAPVVAFDSARASGTGGAANNAGSGASLSTGGAIAELEDNELRALLAELDALEAAPVGEPESIPGGRFMAAGSAGTEG